MGVGFPIEDTYSLSWEIGNRPLTLWCLLGLLLNWPELNNNNNMASVNERELSTALLSGFLYVIKYPRPLFAALCIQTAQSALLNLAVHLNLIIFIYMKQFFLLLHFVHTYHVGGILWRTLTNAGTLYQTSLFLVFWDTDMLDQLATHRLWSDMTVFPSDIPLLCFCSYILWCSL